MSEPLTVYKLTKPDRTTHGGFHWTIGEWAEARGYGPLCADGWLHAYEYRGVAALMDPIQGQYTNGDFLFWIGQAEGRIQRAEDGKLAAQRLRLLEPATTLVLSMEQRVEIAIRVVMMLPDLPPVWRKWANGWLSGEDRTEAAAREAWAAAAAATEAEAAAQADLARTILIRPELSLVRPERSTCPRALSPRPPSPGLDIPADVEVSLSHVGTEVSTRSVAIHDIGEHVDPKLPLRGRLSAAMRVAQDFWLSGDDNVRFKGAVGAVLSSMWHQAKGLA